MALNLNNCHPNRLGRHRVITDINSVHPVGVFAQITSVFAYRSDSRKGLDLTIGTLNSPDTKYSNGSIR
jgi:hypothetical protein